MNQKKAVIGILVFLFTVLVFGTFQLVNDGGDQQSQEGESGFLEKKTDIISYHSIRNSGDKIVYAGLGEDGSDSIEESNYVKYGDERFGPFGIILRVWDTEEEPFFETINESGQRNLYLGEELVTTTEGTELVYNPTIVDGEPVYQKMTINEEFYNEMTENIDNVTEESISEIIEESSYHYTTNQSSEVMQSSLFVGDEEKGSDFDMVQDYTVVDGDIVYSAREDGREFIVENGVKQEEYSEVRGLMELDGEPVYIASERGSDFIVQGDQENARYDSIKELTLIDGEIGYIAEDRGYQLVVVGGMEGPLFGGQYHGLKNLVEVDGEPAYIADKIEDPFVMVGGSKTESYDKIYELKEVGEEAAFSVFEDGEEYMVHGEEELQKFKQVNSFVDVGGEVAYSATNGNENISVMKGGEMLGSYEEILGPVEIGNKTAFLYSNEDFEGRKMYYGGKESKQYDNITSMTQINDKPFFLGERNKNQYVVEFNEG